MSPVLVLERDDEEKELDTESLLKLLNARSVLEDLRVLRKLLEARY